MSRPLKTASIRQPGIAFSLVLLSVAWLLAGCSGTGTGPNDNPAAALDEIHAQRVLAPAEPYWPYRQAEWQRKLGEMDLARASLDTALTLDPDYAPATALLSKIQFEAGQYEAAATLLQSFLDRNPEAPDALRVALALNLQSMFESERSVEILATCDKKSGAVRTAQAFVQLQGADFESSLAEVRATVEADPQSAANQNNHGISLLYAGQPEEARQAFHRALEIDPQLPGSLYNLAIVENFYFFDRTASQDYFQRYQVAMKNRPLADPDDLGATLANPVGAQARLSETGAAHD